jgi:hypothetical protein
VEFGLTVLLAVVILPFGIGWWIGHPVFAAAVFVAMSLTVALGAIGRGDTAGEPAMGLALSLAVSAVSAAGGGYLRARRRARRLPPG